MITITRAIATKVRDTVAAGLSKGLGSPKPGLMCVEAAVCYALGLPHGDDPGCVSQAVRALKIKLNDSSWSSSAARATGLRRLALVQLGSLGTVDDKDFAKRVAEMTIRKIVPIALRAAASSHPDQKHKAALLEAATLCEAEGTEASVRSANKVARAADAAYAAYAAAAAYAADAVYAAAAAYAAAAYAAAAAADAADAAAAARDTVLAAFAEGVVQVLIAMNAPGCQWLDLVPIHEAA